MGQHFQRVLVPEGLDHVRRQLRVNHSRPLGQGTALWIVRKLQQEQMGRHDGQRHDPDQVSPRLRR